MAKPILTKCRISKINISDNGYADWINFLRENRVISSIRSISKWANLMGALIKFPINQKQRLKILWLLSQLWGTKLSYSSSRSRRYSSSSYTSRDSRYTRRSYSRSRSRWQDGMIMILRRSINQILTTNTFELYRIFLLY